MRTKQDIVKGLKDSGVVAVIRAGDSSALIDVARALAAGGVRYVEITMTVPGAIEVIRDAVQKLGQEAVLGAGTVLDSETALAAIRAGAQYIVSPALRPAVIELCRSQDIACIPGAMTPTEVLSAWEQGADIVKIFPAGVVGPQFFKDLKGPFPEIELMPTGGVTLETAPAFIRAGACAVGVGGELVSKALIAARDLERIRHNARQFVEAVRQARNQRTA